MATKTTTTATAFPGLPEEKTNGKPRKASTTPVKFRVMRKIESLLQQLTPGDRAVVQAWLVAELQPKPVEYPA